MQVSRLLATDPILLPVSTHVPIFAPATTHTAILPTTAPPLLHRRVQPMLRDQLSALELVHPTEDCPHDNLQVGLGSVMVAAKFFDDIYYDNAYYAKVCALA